MLLSRAFSCILRCTVTGTGTGRWPRWIGSRRLPLPGLGRDDIKVQLEEGSVLLVGGRAKEESNQEVIWHLAERGRGDFSRQIALPIEAGVDNGVVTIVVPKYAAAKTRPRNIAISSKI
ncbi:16.0 kDa heat shock protein, peroxisomal-like [Aristolochia californica]|uniref:16.0 kDa heat shock protein, peroxisomal-like n=1 Tax=Aristolochia californica TaxID=171875 RepID=UPI0035D5EEC8